jgi:hypothetical protein
VACVAGGAWETAFREHMAKPFSQKYPKVKLHLDLSGGHRAARQAPGGPRQQSALRRGPDARRADGHRDARRSHRSFTAAEVPNIKTFYAISTPAKWQKDGRYFAAHQNWGQLGITYRTDKVKNPPKEWLDFWKPEYKGLVGMPPVSYSVGLQFFIATVHALGGDEKNPADVDRGFEKMKELKASIAQQPADAGAIQQLLERGDIAVVPLWDGRAFGLAAAGLPIGFNYPTKPGPVASGAGNGIARGTQNRAAALKLSTSGFRRRRRKDSASRCGTGRRTAR